MRTRLAAVFICLLLILSLAGCVHADRALTLNNDGTGVYSLSVGLSDQMVKLGGASLVTTMNTFGDRVKQQGGTYSRYEDTGYSYWKYVRPFTSVGQLNTFLAESPQSGSTTNGTAPDTHSTLHVVEDQGFFSTTYHVTGQLALEFPQVDQAARDLLKDVRESFAVTMPGWVSAQSGGTQKANTVTYTVHLDESTTVDVTGGGLNAQHIALVAGGALLALLLVIVGLVLFRRRARRPARPAPELSASPYHMPTQPGSESATYPATSDPTAEYPYVSPTLPPMPSLPPTPRATTPTPTPE